MGAAGIRAGAAYVELTAVDAKLIKGLQSAQRRLQSFGAAVGAIGMDLLKTSAGLTTPFLAGLKVFGDLEQELANLRAAANPTEAEFAAIKKAVTDISQKTGAGPAEVARSFTELLKAGVSVQTVLNGAGEAVIKFAKVGGLDAAEAAVIMSDALNAFGREGLSATQVIDAFSKAADASSVSIKQITESFSMAAAVFSAGGQHLSELTTAIGLLGNAGLKGSDAGTSLKTLLLSLMAPSEEAAKAIAELGIVVRDTEGNLLPMRQIIGELSEKLAGLDQASKEGVLKKIFGTDAIRAALILLEKGVSGWDEFNQKLAGSLSVGQKFAIMTNTLQGALQKFWSALQRIGIAIGEAIAGPVNQAGTAVMRYVSMFEEMVSKHQEIVVMALKVVGAIAAIGVALLAVAATIKVMAFAFGGIATIFSAVGTLVGWIGSIFTAMLTPIGLVITALVGLGAYFLYASGTGAKALAWLGEKFDLLREFATKSFQGISDALAAGDMALAARVLWLSLQLAWRKGIFVLQDYWISFKEFFLSTLTGAFYGAAALLADAFFGLQKAWINSTTYMANAWTIFTEAVGYGWRTTQLWIEKGLYDLIGLIKKFPALFEAIAPGTKDVLELLGLDQIDPEEAKKLADQSYHGDRRQMEGERDTEVKSRSKERDQQIKEINQERQGTLAAIADEADQEDKARKSKHDKERADSEGELKQARKEWQDAIDEAKKKREAFDAGSKGPEKEAPPEVKAPEIAEKLKGVAPVIQAKAQKIFDVTGTFNAEATRGLGLGNTVQDRTAKAAEETAKNTKKILQNMGQSSGSTFE